MYSWNESSFSLTFRIDGEGTIGAEGLLRGDSEGGSAHFSFRDSAGALFTVSSRERDDYTPFDLDATIGPGTYRNWTQQCRREANSRSTV